MIKPSAQHTFEFFWKDRAGRNLSTCPIIASTIGKARRIAVNKWNYPGHDGRWWNYFFDDLHAFLTRWRRRTW